MLVLLKREEPVYPNLVAEYKTSHRPYKVDLVSITNNKIVAIEVSCF
jgi:hypothetical protein